MRKTLAISVVSLLVLTALLLIGCSDHGPANVIGGSDAWSAEMMTEEPVQFMAQIMTTDYNQRRLTFAGSPDTVTALNNCEIVRLNNDTEAPVPFVNLVAGDTVLVSGNRYQSGYIYAYQLKACTGECECLGYDAAFRDTITGIDYAAGSFTVAIRPETVTIDENTLIWGVLSRLQQDAFQLKKQEGQTSKGTCEGNGYRVMRSDTLLAFTDLQVGDVVEVRAWEVSPGTLLAGMIKRCECGDAEEHCVQFSDYLASVDAETGNVTFQNNDWVGTVCPGATLTGIDGETLTLADFTAGEFVAVKGVPLEDGTLKISRMEKTTL